MTFEHNDLHISDVTLNDIWT